MQILIDYFKGYVVKYKKIAYCILLLFGLQLKMFLI